MKFLKLGRNCALWFLLLNASVHADPVIATVFYDMPENLLPQKIPAPTAALLATPGYPNDDERMTLVARIYLPDPRSMDTDPALPIPSKSNGASTRACPIN